MIREKIERISKFFFFIHYFAVMALHALKLITLVQVSERSQGIGVTVNILQQSSFG